MLMFKIKKFTTEDELLDYINKHNYFIVVYNMYYESKSRKYCILYKMDDEQEIKT
jgi:hypothetical protein